MKKFDESMYGAKVKFINKEAHENDPWFYPPVGTIGTIIHNNDYDKTDPNDVEWKVRWPKNSISCYNSNCFSDDESFVDEESIEFISKSNINYNEIWKMLEPKMEKNGLDHYEPNDFKIAVAIAYKCGYERAKKGKPFEYNRKDND